MTKEIESTINQTIEDAGVTYSVTYRGVKNNALGGTAEMDMWACTFTSSKGSQEFDFYTGLGLRAPIGKPTNEGPMPRKGSLMYEEMEKRRKPVPPCAASVLHSLILDSCAVGQSFGQWCSDLGYDTDSRKALATYEACQINGDKLNRIFDRATISKLREALQDY